MFDDHEGFIVLFLVIIILCCIGFGIWVHVTYGNTPVSDLPAWVLPWFR